MRPLRFYFPCKRYFSVIMANKTAPHILSTSGNLLGFCLIVITSVHISGKTKGTLFDEFTSIIAMMLTLSCMLSFASIRTHNLRREHLLENIADLLFLLALTGIILIIAFITMTFWNKK